MESKRMEKYILCERKPKESQGGNPISDKIDFKIKNIIRDKGHYIIKESIQREDITIVNIYACNTAARQYLRQTLTGVREETDSNTKIVGDFNTPVTPVDRSSKQNQ